MEEKRSAQSGLWMILFYILVGGYTIVALFPFFWSFVISLKPTATVNEFAINFSQLSFDNYRFIFEKFPYLTWFMNSVLVALGVTLGSIAVSSLAGYALARMEFPGRKVAFWMVLAIMMVPVQVVVVPLFVLLAKMGWVNTYQGLIVPFVFSCFNIFLMRQFFLAMPKEIEEAAMIDGAGRFRIFCRIIMPMAKPALAAQFILTFTGTWNEFFWPSLLCRHTTMYTLPVGLNSFYITASTYSFGIRCRPV